MFGVGRTVANIRAHVDLIGYCLINWIEQMARHLPKSEHRCFQNKLRNRNKIKHFSDRERIGFSKKRISALPTHKTKSNHLYCRIYFFAWKLLIM